MEERILITRRKIMTTHPLKHPSHQLNCQLNYHKQKSKQKTNISEQLTGYVKIFTFDTFYESLLESKYSVSSKRENFNEENGKQR